MWSCCSLQGFGVELKDEVTPGLLALGLSQKLHPQEPSAPLGQSGSDPTPRLLEDVGTHRVCCHDRHFWDCPVPCPGVWEELQPQQLQPAELCLPPSLLLSQQSLGCGLLPELLPEHHPLGTRPVLPKLSEKICTWHETNGMWGFEGVWDPPGLGCPPAPPCHLLIILQCSTAAPAGILGDIFHFPLLCR